MANKYLILPVFIILTGFFTTCRKRSARECEEEMLRRLEQITSASYYIATRAWSPGDTLNIKITSQFVKERIHPADTTMGASYIQFDESDTTCMTWAYDGNFAYHVLPEARRVEWDDFSRYGSLPFRPVNAPFFHLGRAILHYILTTNDSIETQLTDAGDDFLLTLTIHEPQQVEFFGKVCKIPENPYVLDPTSIYKLWINKESLLPYRIYREMYHQISEITCSQPHFNAVSEADMEPMRYYPADYLVVKRGMGKQASSRVEDLLNKPAPQWTLRNEKGEAVSSDQFQGEVMLLQLTGIGCGPCMQSIPFLNRLNAEFAPEQLSVVAIETWRCQPSSSQAYIDRYHIHYPFLCGNDSTAEAFRHANRAVPYFLLLDRQRIVRHIFFGYSQETTDKEITDAIRQMNTKGKYRPSKTQSTDLNPQIEH